MIEAVFTAVSVYPRASILQTYSIEVTLHFELCKTITSNFATLSPMSLPARLFHISISSFSCVKDIGITHMIEVTLQFGLCNAPTSDFAPFSPIGNLLRLLQCQVSLKKSFAFKLTQRPQPFRVSSNPPGTIRPCPVHS